MANFKGTAQEFNSFIGPLLRNIVCNMARKFKKHKSCQHVGGCGKRTKLEAAHKKGFERPVIIASLLEKYQIGNDNLYDVDLIDFEKRFIEVHNPIEKIIIPLCKEHHFEYDKKEGIKPELPLLLDEFEDENGVSRYTDSELEEFEKIENEGLQNNLKIGEYVRRIFKELEENDKLSIDTIDNLCHEGYSKETFNINYPVLIEFQGDLDVIKDSNDKSRYFVRNQYVFFSKTYLLCSEWYKESRSKVEEWYNTVK